METDTEKNNIFSMNKEYEKSLEFWNRWLGQEDEIPEDFDPETAWSEIGSQALVDAASSMASRKNVLDYGCGSGWAAVIMAKKGCENVTAVEVSENGIKSAKKYAELFDLDKKIDFRVIPTDWLLNEEENKYDGFLCINVLDVVPRTITENILKGAYRVCKAGAKLIIGMNFYMDSERMVKTKAVELEKNHLFLDGILRMVNYTDEEWTVILGRYFKVTECRHFRWDGEPETVNRRLFILEKEQ